MKALWTEDEGGFTGEYVDFPPSFAWPKPVQKPHPPILLGGGGGPKLFEAIAAYGDGWMPIGGAGVRKALPELHAAMEAAGRDPAELTIIPFGVMPDPGKIDYYAEIGFDEVVFRVPPAPAAQGPPHPRPPRRVRGDLSDQVSPAGLRRSPEGGRGRHGHP